MKNYLRNLLSGQSSAISVSSVCPSSNAVITTPSDVAVYELCTELDSISISATSGIADVTLPNLVTVHDSIYVSNNSDLQDISFLCLFCALRASDDFISTCRVQNPDILRPGSPWFALVLLGMPRSAWSCLVLSGSTCAPGSA